MQGMNKLEQQDPTSENLQVDVKKLIDCLESGKKSAHMMRSLILQNNPRVKMENDYDDQHQDQDHYKSALHHHSIVCLDTYASSLSMLKSLDFDEVFARKRKQEHFDDVDHCSSYEESADQGSPINVNVKRECFKRRKFGDSSREKEVTHLTDDGFAWRKYGQKLILNSYHPRHYYRCTHKHDKKCEATKQVQQVSDKPIKYKVIYHGNHTCNNNIHKIDPFTIDSPGVHPSAFVLNFYGTNQQVNPMLFPTSTFPDVEVNWNSSPSVSSNNNLSVSQNTTVTTTDGLSSSPVYEESSELSIAENYSSSNATSANLEEDYSLIMADFSDMLPFWWTN